MTTTRLVDESLFAADGDEPGHAGVPSLLGSRCGDCGTTTFPRQDTCPRCGGAAMAGTVLPRTGTIWSATVQHFPPKPPFRHGIPSDRRIGKRPPYRTKQVRLSRETQNGSCLGLNFGLWVESGRFCRPCKRQQSADCVEKLRKQNL